MHRCLEVHEVFTNICEQLATIEQGCGGSGGGRTLAALALSCRKLSPLALDVLWRKLTSIMPVIRCMPDDLWLERRLHENPAVTELILRRPIKDTDWNQVLRYTRRVKLLCEAETGGSVFCSKPRLPLIISAASIESILRCPPQTPLFPNLRQLSIASQFAPSFIIPIQYLIPHSRCKLSHIRLQFSRSNTDISFLSSSCGTVKCLEIAKAAPRCAFDRVKQQVFDSICTLTSLEKLVAPTLNATTFLHVSSLSSLQELKLTNLDNDPFLLSFFSDHRKQLAFPSLQRLGVSGVNLDLITPFFHTIKRRLSLIELSIVILTPHVSSDWDALLTAVVNACSQKTLRTLTLSEPITTYFLPNEQLYESISAAPLHHLLSFPYLKDVIIAVFSLRPHDENLGAMARTWNDSLRSLSMSPHALKRGGYQMRPGDYFDLGPILGIGLPNIWHDGVSTLRCLIPFAKHCPNLGHLDLGVELSTDDTNTITDIPTELEGSPIGIAPTIKPRFQHHTALNLCLDMRFKSDVQTRLATFISSIFHNIVGMPFQARLLDAITDYYRTRNRSVTNHVLSL